MIAAVGERASRPACRGHRRGPRCGFTTTSAGHHLAGGGWPQGRLSSLSKHPAAGMVGGLDAADLGNGAFGWPVLPFRIEEVPLGHTSGSDRGPDYSWPAGGHWHSSEQFGRGFAFDRLGSRRCSRAARAAASSNLGDYRRRCGDPPSRKRCRWLEIADPPAPAGRMVFGNRSMRAARRRCGRSPAGAARIGGATHRQITLDSRSRSRRGLIRSLVRIARGDGGPPAPRRSGRRSPRLSPGLRPPCGAARTGSGPWPRKARTHRVAVNHAPQLPGTGGMRFLDRPAVRPHRCGHGELAHCLKSAGPR